MKQSLFLVFAAATCLVKGCHNNASHDHSHHSQEQKTDTSTVLPDWVDYIDKETFIGSPSIVNCTLSGGAQTQCLSVTLQPQPASMTIGPWCPRSIDDGADMAGLWLDEGKVYDVDGEFIQNLSTFYSDDKWQLFDPKTGKVNVTDTKLSCEAAARPDVDPAYQNHCVECQMSYLPDNKNITYVIPIKPQFSDSVAPRVDHSGVGLAYSGARLDASAPLDAILAAYTIAAFDDCGGHVNPAVGYHIHAVTEKCLVKANQTRNHAAEIGVAMDGYRIHERLNPNGEEPLDLDMCRGHITEVGYHYHVDTAGSNAILPCHSGQTGCALEDGGSCDASQLRSRPPRGQRPRPIGKAPPGDRPPHLDKK
ncbi:YHYH protein [Fretibacter rubidus]|uniref:YHYH protein n=1 Tax=Fretibacter rubidus TaxID=570162 RepID=UPI00352BBD77